MIKYSILMYCMNNNLSIMTEYKVDPHFLCVCVCVCEENVSFDGTTARMFKGSSWFSDCCSRMYIT